MVHHHILAMRTSPTLGREVRAFTIAGEPTLHVHRMAHLILRTEDEGEPDGRVQVVKDRLDLFGTSSTAKVSTCEEIAAWLSFAPERDVSSVVEGCRHGITGYCTACNRAQEASQEAQEGGASERRGGEFRFAFPGDPAGPRTAAQAFREYGSSGMKDPHVMVARSLLSAVFNEALTWDQQARVLESLGWRRA